MIQAQSVISNDLAVELEAYFCEYDGCLPWSIFQKDKHSERLLCGYFETRELFQDAWKALRKAHPELSESPTLETLEDRDWQEAYKAFLKPWSSRHLHWVPTWMKEDYAVPTGNIALYFDAGMAFGTGNHETTQLCAHRLLDFQQERGDSFSQAHIIDAGCGSGILAISASLLGCQHLYGFDRDPEAIRVSHENATFNGLAADTILFKEHDIENGLIDQQADLLLANIQADVLSIHAQHLITSVRPGGTLAMSGILAKEIDDVRQHFTTEIQKSPQAIETVESKTQGEWADLLFKFKTC